jgi:hypothetical protein
MENSERDEIDDDIIGATNIAVGMAYLPIALTLALIDKGTIDPARLRDIMASLRTILECDFELRFGTPQDATIGLDHLEQYLDGFPWKQGQVVEQLRLHEASETAKSLLRAATQRPHQED